MMLPTALTVLRRVYPQLIPQRLISWLTLRRFIDKVIRDQLVEANHSVTILFRRFVMLFVGIDVASRKHDVAITTFYGEVLTAPFTIPNNLDGYKKLRDEIVSHTEHLDDVRIGIEETGIYSKNIAEFLALCGFTVHMINPVLTSNSRKSQSIRLTKTDKIDALAICRYVEFNYKRLNSYTSTLYIFSEIKSLSRARLDIQEKLIRAKSEWTRLLDISFPEFRLKFNQHSKWVYQLFSDYPTSDRIAKMHLNTLVSIIRIQGDRYEAARCIKSIATSTIGSSSPTTRLLLKNTLADIRHYTSQMDDFEREIEIIIETHFSNILTVPGVGPIVAGLIIGEIGDVTRFHSPHALVAFAGIDPVVFESGLFKAKKVGISKRGSKYLRSALYTATKVAIINPNIRNNKFRDKYLKKITEGKHHNSAIFSAAKNMCNTIFALLNSGKEFDYSL